MRKKIKEEAERHALKEAVLRIASEPLVGKKLKGEFKDFRNYRYFVKGQERRLNYPLVRERKFTDDLKWSKKERDS